MFDKVKGNFIIDRYNDIILYYNKNRDKNLTSIFCDKTKNALLQYFSKEENTSKKQVMFCHEAFKIMANYSIFLKEERSLTQSELDIAYARIVSGNQNSEIWKRSLQIICEHYITILNKEDVHRKPTVSLVNWSKYIRQKMSTNDFFGSSANNALIVFSEHSISTAGKLSKQVLTAIAYKKIYDTYIIGKFKKDKDVFFRDIAKYFSAYKDLRIKLNAKNFPSQLELTATKGLANQKIDYILRMVSVLEGVLDERVVKNKIGAIATFSPTEIQLFKDMSKFYLPQIPNYVGTDKADGQ